MLKSMTGVGRAEAKLTPWNARVSVDIRTVNHKYFELVPRLPGSIAGHEGEIRELVRRKVRRGYVQLTLNIEGSADAPVLALDERLVSDYLKLARQLQVKHKLPGTVDINTILSFPGIIASEKTEQNRARLWRQVRKVVNEALDRLVKMRRVEGANLCRDMRKRIARIQHAVRIIERRVPARLKERRQNLALQLKELDVQADPRRVVEEIAFIADKLDIHEECVRLRSHCSVFVKALGVTSTSGKKLDFLAQEMLRETDTLSAKARDLVISRRAIEIKGEIEKLKEQVRNVE
ncbi:YicC family protein [candidate division WOR-3 bacterium]|nr:YicC family protein [candidate division WOR-3 bacterium]